MSTPPAKTNSYLLIDNGQLDEAHRYADPTSEARPRWLLPIYDDKALQASPLLVDIETAWELGQLDEATKLLNVQKPELHVSFLDTTLGHAELAHHLRRFIFVFSEEGRQFTLRFADCLVLVALEAILTPEQWAAVMAPLARWCVHDRTGAIVRLAGPSSEASVIPTPLSLSGQQFELLTEAMEPDHCIAKVLAMRHGARLPGDPRSQHEWASDARKTWQATGNGDNLMLLHLTDAALATQGRILRRSEIPALLCIPDLGTFTSELRKLVECIDFQ